MLNDQEREMLREVQRQLVLSDPRFARSFDALDARHSSCSFPWAYTIPGLAYTTVMILAVVLGLLMLVAGAPGTALAFAALAATTRAVRRHQYGDSGRPE